MCSLVMFEVWSIRETSGSCFSDSIICYLFSLFDPSCHLVIQLSIAYLLVVIMWLVSNFNKILTNWISLVPSLVVTHSSLEFTLFLLEKAIIYITQLWSFILLHCCCRVPSSHVQSAPSRDYKKWRVALGNRQSA